MRNVYLILGAQNSQALGLVNDDRNLLYENSYKPFLKLLYNHPDIRFTLYYSGLLLEWLDKHHSEYVDVLTEMVKRRQVELLGGAFFEPMLPMIPKTDRIGQIERLTTHLRKSFGRRPRGAWIPESVWDQRIAANLRAGGIEYAFLDAEVFGFREDGRDNRPVLTEDEGKTLTIFPTANAIIDDMFEKPPEEIIESLRKITDSNRAGTVAAPVVSLITDGSSLAFAPAEAEKIVLWYDRFLDLITQNTDWLHVQIPGRIMRTHAPHQRVYAATTGIDHLMRWADACIDGSKPVSGSVSGRSFRSVMEAYPESARLYAKMQHTHVLVNQVRGDKYRKMTARKELWRGQSHFAYWHNRFGGIYRSSLRKATYSALIEAEKTTRERGIFIPAVSRADVDLDGDEEILYQGNEINAYVHRTGGRVFELDYVPRNWNYLDTFNRRPEVFHDETTAAAGYDNWPRQAFVDHLLKPGQNVEAFARGSREQICDLTGLSFEIESIDKDHNEIALIGTCRNEATLAQIVIHKIYRFIKSRIDVEYTLSNTGMDDVEAELAVETNLSFRSLEPGDLRIHLRQGRQRTEISPDTFAAEGMSDLQFLDLANNTIVTINPSDRPDLWSFPVEAVGMLWNRPNWFYQANCAVVRWPLQLGAGDERTFTYSLRIDRKK